jgi:hypothetical protein
MPLAFNHFEAHPASTFGQGCNIIESMQGGTGLVEWGLCGDLNQQLRNSFNNGDEQTWSGIQS